MKKTIGIIVLLVGVALFIIGIVWQIPGTHLSTYSLSGAGNSKIEEYVGGDAYNYIIGASLVSGRISGIITMKAIFIAIGTLIICISALFLAYTYKASVRTAFPRSIDNTIPIDSQQQAPRVSYAPMPETNPQENNSAQIEESADLLKKESHE